MPLQFACSLLQLLPQITVILSSGSAFDNVPGPDVQVPASVAELGSDWYLDRIEVTGPEGVCWRFPCDAWFGRSEGDDYTGGSKLQLDILRHCFSAWTRLTSQDIGKVQGHTERLGRH